MKALILVIAALAAAGCATQPPRQAQEPGAIDPALAERINKICSLPKAEREAALAKLRAETGLVVYCGREDQERK
jgi:hypothetical protein